MREILELLLTDKIAARPALLVRLTQKDLSWLKEMEEDILQQYLEALLLAYFGPIVCYYAPFIVEMQGKIYKFETPASFIRFLETIKEDEL